MYVFTKQHTTYIVHQWYYMPPLNSIVDGSILFPFYSQAIFPTFIRESTDYLYRNGVDM